MNRRDSVLALLALGAPIRLMAQRSGTVYRIGFLGGGLPSTSKSKWRISRRNARPRLRGGADLRSRFPVGRRQKRSPCELAAELVRANVDVIVTTGEPAIRAAKQATTQFP